MGWLEPDDSTARRHEEAKGAWCSWWWSVFRIREPPQKWKSRCLKIKSKNWIFKSTHNSYARFSYWKWMNMVIVRVYNYPRLFTTRYLPDKPKKQHFFWPEWYIFRGPTTSNAPSCVVVLSFSNCVVVTTPKLSVPVVHNRWFDFCSSNNCNDEEIRQHRSIRWQTHQATCGSRPSAGMATWPYLRGHPKGSFFNDNVSVTCFWYINL